MKLFSSPTKTLKPVEKDMTSPLFKKETKKILNELQKLKLSKLKSFYKASDKIVHHQYENLKNPTLLGPAGWVYQGESFRNLDIQSANQEYLRDHLLIGSALYGLSTIDTETIDHRLDLTRRLNEINLVEYWQPKIKKFFKDELIINCASNEYRQLIEGLNIVDIIFLDDNKVKSTYAKAARGLFIRECSLQEIKNVNDLKTLNILDYQFNPELSNDQVLTFTR